MNMSMRYKKTIRGLILLASALIIVFAGWEIYNSMVFRLVGTNPEASNLSTVTPFFKIVFNKDLNKKSLAITASPGLMDSYSINGSTITVLLNIPLSQGNKYSLLIRGVQSTNGQVLPNEKYNLEPQNIPPDELPQDQQQTLSDNQQQYDRAILGNKIVKYLPFTGGGNEFRVSYTARYINQKAQLVIVITSPSQQGFSDALSWIRLIGFNPNDYQIRQVNASL